MEEITFILREHVEGSLRHIVVAADLMSPVAATVSPEDTLDHCLTLFSHHHVHELPVVDTDQRLVGWIGQSDVIDFYNREILRRDAVLKFDQGPEARETKEELVHLASGQIKEEIEVNGELAGKSLRDLDLRARFGLHVYLVRHTNGGSDVPNPATPLSKGDTLVLIGPEDKMVELRKLAHS